MDVKRRPGRSLLNDVYAAHTCRTGLRVWLCGSTLPSRHSPSRRFTAYSRTPPQTSPAFCDRPSWAAYTISLHTPTSRTLTPSATLRPALSACARRGRTATRYRQQTGSVICILFSFIVVPVGSRNRWTVDARKAGRRPGDTARRGSYGARKRRNNVKAAADEEHDLPVTVTTGSDARWYDPQRTRDVTWPGSRRRTGRRRANDNRRNGMAQVGTSGDCWVLN